MSVTMMFAKLGLNNRIHQRFFSQSCKCSFCRTFNPCQQQQPTASYFVPFGFQPAHMVIRRWFGPRSMLHSLHHVQQLLRNSQVTIRRDYST